MMSSKICISDLSGFYSETVLSSSQRSSKYKCIKAITTLVSGQLTTRFQVQKGIKKEVVYHGTDIQTAINSYNNL